MVPLMPRSLHRVIALVCTLAVSPAGIGCGFKTINVPLAQHDPAYGYRPARREVRRDRGDISVYLALSGGGTRAAALAYGVMKALRDTQVFEGARRRTLLEEVDTISGVSGGSFPAAYYGLFGDRLFEDFERRFLRRNIQAGILWRALVPWNLVALMTPWLSRSDIARGIYDRSVFDGATFETLTASHGPVIYINATDLSSGERFTFAQGTFDLICSDLQALKVADAVAASSAVPMLLAPISMRSYAGECGFEPPAVLEEALRDPVGSPRQYRIARAYVELGDPDKKFLHLIDGAISDNLGLRPGLDLVETAGGLARTAELMDTDLVDRMVVIVVNAEIEPDARFDFSYASPGFAATMGAVTGAQIRRNNFETLMATHGILERARHEAAGIGRTLETFLIEVSFANLPDAVDRTHFGRIPTNFHLSDQRVDELIWAGRQLLVDSPDYERLIRSTGGVPAEATPRSERKRLLR